MEIGYEQAHSEDMEQIRTLCERLILDYEDLTTIDLPKVMGWVGRKLASSIEEYTAIMVDGRKAGYYHLFRNENGSMELDDLYILPEFRNQGIGSLVVERCISQADGPLMLYVFARNTKAVSFYERHGFSVSETIGTSRYIMRRP